MDELELDDGHTKRPWQSKSLWLSLITVIAGFFPPVQAFIAADPELVTTLVGGLNIITRFKTKDKIKVKK